MMCDWGGVVVSVSSNKFKQKVSHKQANGGDLEGHMELYLEGDTGTWILTASTRNGRHIGQT